MPNQVPQDPHNASTAGVVDQPNVLKYVLTPGFIALVALAVVPLVIGLWFAAGDGRGDRPAYFFMAGCSPVVPVLYATLRTAWHREPDFMLSLRAITPASFFAVVPLTLIAMVTVALPPVARKIDAAMNPKNGWHYFFDQDMGHPVWHAVMAVGIMGLIACLLTGVTANVLIVVPLVAFRHKRAFARQNLLDTSPEFASDNAKAGKATAVLLILILLIPTLIVVGNANTNSDNLWQAIVQCWNVFLEPQIYWADMALVLGVALVPVGVFLLIYVRVTQRPDIQARGALGLNALGDERKHFQKKDAKK